MTNPTQDYPPTEIVSGSPYGPHTERARKAAAGRKAAREARQRHREATQETLEGGATVYLDTPPGIGFVLQFPNGRKKYYMTKAQAIRFWIDVYRADHGI